MNKFVKLCLIVFLFWICLYSGSFIAESGEPANGGTVKNSAAVYDVSSLRAVYANKQVGQRFQFGRYPQGPKGEVKPITWRVLQRDSDSLLVISEYGLDAKPYNKGRKSELWLDSSLRLWLNFEFMEKAFSQQEQSLIKTSYLRCCGNLSDDRIFVLCEDEARMFFDDAFSDCDDRIVIPTPYAIKNGAYTYNKHGWWWLQRKEVVDTDGAIVRSGAGEANAAGTVRPAFRVALNPPALSKPSAVSNKADNFSAESMASLRAVYANKKVGERFEFGRDPLSPTGDEPITWRVLRRDRDSLLVVSEHGLDAKSYNEKWVDVDWAGCTLRRWLNEEFLEQAFNDQEQSLIKMSHILNNAGPDTYDRVFLLSIDEAIRYFADAKDRMIKPTPYYHADTLRFFGTGIGDGTVQYWLRSRANAESYGSYASLVDFQGQIITRYAYQVSYIKSVRPALRLSL